MNLQLGVSTKCYHPEGHMHDLRGGSLFAIAISAPPHPWLIPDSSLTHPRLIPAPCPQNRPIVDNHYQNTHPVHQMANSVYGNPSSSCPARSGIPSRTPKPRFRVRRIRTGPELAGSSAPGLSCVARFERSAGVFADRAAS